MPGYFRVPNDSASFWEVSYAPALGIDGGFVDGDRSGWLLSVMERLFLCRVAVRLVVGKAVEGPPS